MDAVDRRIIAALGRTDGPPTPIWAGRSACPRPPCTSGSANSRATGVIIGYHAVVDPSAVGLGVTALIGIHLHRHRGRRRGRDALGALHEVESCYAVAGDEAFIVKVRVATVDELEHALGRLRRIHGVARTRTTVVLSTRFEGRPNTPAGTGSDQGEE